MFCLKHSIFFKVIISISINLINYTFQNYELILIDDGSNQKTKKITGVNPAFSKIFDQKISNLIDDFNISPSFPITLLSSFNLRHFLFLSIIKEPD